MILWQDVGGEMRVQLELPERTVEKLKALMNEVGAKTYSEIFGYALTGLDWMAKERRAGRLIVSTDPDFNQFRELSMPILDAIGVAGTKASGAPAPTGA